MNPGAISLDALRRAWLSPEQLAAIERLAAARKSSEMTSEGDPMLGGEEYGQQQPDFTDPASYTPPITPITQQRYPFRLDGSGRDLSYNDRGIAYDEGNRLDSEINENLWNERADRLRYQDSADQAYDPLLRGEGGYTEDEYNRIMQGEQLTGLDMTGEEYDQSYLTGEEGAAIFGDPNSQRQWFDPATNWDIENTGASRVRDAYGNLQDRLDSAVNPAALRMRQGWGEEYRGEADLGGQNIRSALSGPDVEISDAFLEDYKMSPDEQQDMILAAMQGVGNKYRGEIADFERRANAAGINPAGVASLKDRMMRHSASDAADAGLRARVSTNREAADRLQRGEDMRVGYGQRIAGMRSGAERDIMGARMDALLTDEQMRLGTERDLSDRMQRNAIAGQMPRLQAEQALLNSQSGLQRFLQTTGMGMERDIDRTQSDRARYMGENRQDAARYNQGERFRRGLSINDRVSGRNQMSADARRADSQEARAYNVGMHNAAARNEQAGWDRRTGLYGQRMNAQQGGTRGVLASESTPSTWERILGMGLGAVSGLAGAFGGRPRGGG